MLPPENIQGQGAAGSQSVHNPGAYAVNSFGSTRESGAEHTGIKNSNNELVVQLRDKLAARGARGIIGL